jgi:hypothetical protein
VAVGVNVTVVWMWMWMCVCGCLPMSGVFGRGAGVAGVLVLGVCVGYVWCGWLGDVI